ncbi:DUF1810 domain-containing protein [Oceanibacterium hippocampi]|uniref:Calpastatin n=1 Tax=Oceanibacterium hippocampi TaxID=745714 RepID=A0A1Y5TXE3_9PROT|nr:DUF1810 domain-containing protein [Oceanibacterium hippocampi]SLN75800.1 hypothetical protein OCH7691_03967 [Oceanibacterium hippocampi]
MTDPDLSRFVEAQAAVFDTVIAELTAGRKQSHWMWFVFPQIGGLGHRPTARHFAISDLDQARRYLADPLLGARLRSCARLMLRHAGRTAGDILGTPDDLKLRSSATLFREAACDPADIALFQSLLDGFFDGMPDNRSLERLAC